MGNRAVITTEKKDLAVYMHWNGGRDSVEPILQYCKMKGYRAPEWDCYGWARLAQVIGNFFGGTDCVGISTYERLKESGDDNGVYIIRNWEIVGREDLYDGFEEQQEYDAKEVLQYIDMRMPEEDQLGEYLLSEEVPVEDIKVGDVVFVPQFSGNFVKAKVIGFGEDKVVNGSNVLGVPYVGMYTNKNFPNKDNINNYLREPSYRIAKED